ncbi:ATP-grasp ribosomal peptide maturase, SAV_5884 family [Actinopolyspora alba]|uniref:ATP-grasp ribosomal peptide maturase, SAV_5884 family n=1 Tax=Actinopolyspora alba TaxID=673379 RepID=A0A1I1ZNV9_9ACTN|nr:ATP-grasp ribosomal peptide maturase [Actinopolyspora alba]SFE33028.1 ATP-grasp ribosomal peptide maturase, SAV_5884 family [Actinopolyspora alba]
MQHTSASVAVITRDHDVTADLVINELHRRELPVARFDLAAFPERMRQTTRLTGENPRWDGSLRDAHREIDVSALRSVWYRKPSGFLPHPEMTATERQWAAAEADNGFGGLLAALPEVHWVNHPHRNAAAEHKPHQLGAAASCGLAVPDTLLTNDPEQARAFCDQHRDHGVVYKPLRGGPGIEHGRHVALWADAVAAEEITESVARTTHLFQQRVPCAYPVRLTVVGSRMYAVRMDPPAGATAIDWRTHPPEALSYTPIEVPPATSAGIHRLLEHFGLVYAAADLIVSPDEQWVFHGDLNPNGQWGWIAAHTGLPIAAAIADELTEDRT